MPPLPRLLFAAATAAATCAFVLPARANADKPEYGIKERTAVTGSAIRRDSVSGGNVAINLPYEKLPAADKQALHARWESIAEGDEPPFPLQGLKAILDPIGQGQQRLQETGPLQIVATVNAQGDVESVAVLATPNKKLSDFAAQVLLLTKFKPAKCAGAPCKMDFPVLLQLGVRR